MFSPCAKFSMSVCKNALRELWVQDTHVSRKTSTRAGLCTKTSVSQTENLYFCVSDQRDTCSADDFPILLKTEESFFPTMVQCAELEKQRSTINLRKFHCRLGTTKIFLKVFIFIHSIRLYLTENCIRPLLGSLCLPYNL